MKYAFATLDVFTDRRFVGNPLAVVFDADGIEPQTMQALAREFNHPETVFVHKPAAPTSTASIRIFTPGIELAFAGHPTVGTALILGLKRGRTEIVLEEKIGLLKCQVTPAGSNSGYAQFALPELPKQAGTPASHAAIAAALGLHVADIGFDGLAPARWSAGNTFTFVPLGSLDAVRRCRIDDAQWDAAFEAGGRSSAFVFCRETIDTNNSFHARMFAPRLGVREDPATGSAAAAFTGFYSDARSLGDGQHRFTIEQGHEMGRPSQIELTLTMHVGSLAGASIGGSAIVVTEGMIEV